MRRKDDRWGHTRHFFEQIIRIPGRFWSDEPLRVDGSRLASTIDVGPTLLAEAGLALPGHWEGRPLLPPHRPRTVVVAEDLFYERRWQAVIWDGPIGSLKYLRLASQDRPATQEVLFHLGHDPGESENVFAETTLPSRMRRIAATLTVTGLPLGATPKKDAPVWVPMVVQFDTMRSPDAPASRSSPRRRTR